MGSKKYQQNEALRYQRQLRGWSQQKVADVLETSAVVVNRWENGKRKTSPYYQEKLCDLFGMTAQELGFMGESQTTKKEEEGQTDPNRECMPILAQAGKESELSHTLAMLTPHASSAGTETPLTEQQNLTADFSRVTTPSSSADTAPPLSSTLNAPASLNVITSRRQLLQEMLTFAGAALLTPPYELLNSDALERLAFAIHKPASLDIHILHDLENITNSYLRARAHGAASSYLLNGALGHFRTVIHFLKDSHSIGIQRDLYATTRDASTLIGVLLFDMRDFATAWSYHSIGSSIAPGAGQPDGEAVILGRMSFLFTYRGQPDETPPQTLTLLERAQHLTQQSTTPSLRARLAAIKSEIHANLGQTDMFKREIDLSENLLAQGGQMPGPNTMVNFDRATFAGYKGASLLCLKKPLDALPSLLEARQLQGLKVVQPVLLMDIGTAHAQAGEPDKACMFGHEALAAVAQTRNANDFYRVYNLRHDLDAWKHTSIVKELDHHIESIHTTLQEKEL